MATVPITHLAHTPFGRAPLQVRGNEVKLGPFVFTYDAKVHGWAWDQPAVTDERVYVGTASQVGYLAQHHGGVMALDRATGRPVWRFPAERPAAGSYGFPGSAAVGSGLVFLTGLDGRVYAFAP